MSSLRGLPGTRRIQEAIYPLIALSLVYEHQKNPRGHLPINGTKSSLRGLPGTRRIQEAIYPLIHQQRWESSRRLSPVKMWNTLTVEFSIIKYLYMYKKFKSPD